MHASEGVAQLAQIEDKPPERRRGNPNWAKGADGKGKSGNPGGEIKGLHEFRALCRSYTKQAVKALVFSLEDPTFAVSAAKVLLDHGWGKAPAELRIGGPDGAPMRLEISNDKMLAIYEYALAQKALKEPK